MSYNVSSIVGLSEIEHIQKNPEMYIGSCGCPTRLLHEILDNALDEVQSGYVKKISVKIDTNNNSFLVRDDGRGFPFNQKLELKKDPPVLSCTKLFTSGKFSKQDDKSGYKICSGLHGIGLSACFALSDYLHINIYRDNLFANYEFLSNGKINRSQVKFQSKNRPFSTEVLVKPSNKYFDSLTINIKEIEERLLIATSNFKNLECELIIDDNVKTISGTEEELILNHIGKNVETWFYFENIKKPEKCFIHLGWNNEIPSSQKVFTVVNLARVHDGCHIQLATNAIKNVFAKLAKKYNYDFNENDPLNGMKLYINLSIIKTSFEAQIKVRLGRRSDISIMSFFENDLRKFFEDNKDEYLIPLLERFHNYRKSVQSKNILKNTTSKKRGFSSFTKLRDCISDTGELFICEGDSAEGGLIQARDPKIHAILPIRGVIPNCIRKKNSVENQEVKDIIQSVGTGIGSSCNIEECRYSKICVTCDADPAGHFISSLIIVLFCKLMPDIVKSGRLYLCETPLFGVGSNEKFIPLWTDSDIKKSQKNGHVRRIKGLGEFNPKELKRFVFDEDIRRLIQIKWPIDNNIEKIYSLMENVEDKRNLILGKWEY